MAEIIFILVTVYGVYVVHSIITSKAKKKVKSSTVKAKVSVATASKKEETKAVVKQEKPVAKKVVPAKTKAKPKPKPKAKTKLDSGSLRNPETGEVAKIASSYRMCKRWIKDALVTEGLLEKVYKTNEVDDAAKVKIDKALVKLAKMEKYK